MNELEKRAYRIRLIRERERKWDGKKVVKARLSPHPPDPYRNKCNWGGGFINVWVSFVFGGSFTSQNWRCLGLQKFKRRGMGNHKNVQLLCSL